MDSRRAGGTGVGLERTTSHTDAQTPTLVSRRRIGRGLDRTTVDGEHVDLGAGGIAQGVGDLQIQGRSRIDGNVATDNPRTRKGRTAGQSQGAAVDERIPRVSIDRRQRQRTRTSLRQGSGVSAIIADDGTDCESSGAPLLHDEVVGSRGIAGSEHAGTADCDGIGAGHEQTTGGQRHRVSAERDSVGTRRGELKGIERQRPRGGQRARGGGQAVVGRRRTARRRQRGVGRHRHRTRRGGAREVSSTDRGPREDTVGCGVGEDDAVRRANGAGRIDDVHRRAGGTRDGTKREE